MGKPERTRNHGNCCFAREALPTLDICNLIHRKLTQIRQPLLAHVGVETELFDSNPKIGLYGVYPLHTQECGERQKTMTPSMTTGYSVDTLAPLYALPDLSGEKSKKSRTGIPRVIENASIDSKEGAFRPRSMRLRKSTEMSRNSAKSSCVIFRSFRIERNFLPKSFRNVATTRVWLYVRRQYTEYYYGFRELRPTSQDAVFTPFMSLIDRGSQ